jgi:hypothetical protein
MHVSGMNSANQSDRTYLERKKHLLEREKVEFVPPTSLSDALICMVRLSGTLSYHITQ